LQNTIVLGAREMLHEIVLYKLLLTSLL